MVLTLTASLFFILSPQLVDGSINLERFQQGNALYSAGDYEGAIAAYLSLVDDEVESVELWYNLGNTYYKMGMVGPAVLAYQRALRLSPGEEDVKYNLRVVNLLVKDRIVSPDENIVIKWIRGLRDNFSADSLIRFLTGVYISGIVFYIVTLFMSDGRKRMLLYLLIGTFAVVFVLSGLFTVLKMGHELNNIRAVVMADQMSVTSAPEEIGEELFILHEGTIAEIIGGGDEWVRIRLADGKSGWVPAGLLEII